ncbi:MAG: hypothetical protein LBK44_04150 [Spirochaetales bacterium]|jgi:hypothetical protein|nr:hypothetical protein [Spirochaetales bacterium]
MPLPVTLNNPMILNEHDFNQTNELIDQMLGDAKRQGITIHEKFLTEKPNFWDGCYNPETHTATIQAYSFFWLFLWADTALSNNEDAIVLFRQLFQDIFSCTYDKIKNLLHSLGINFDEREPPKKLTKEATDIRNKLRNRNASAYSAEVLGRIII